MPKPDRRGYYCPEVGGVRFTVGHKSEVSEGEASSGCDPGTVQQAVACSSSPDGSEATWHSTALEIAKQLAKGQQPFVDPPEADDDDPISEHVRDRIYGHRVHESRKWLRNVGIDEGLSQKEVASPQEWFRAEIQRLLNFKEVFSRKQPSTSAWIEPFCGKPEGIANCRAQQDACQTVLHGWSSDLSRQNRKNPGREP